MNIPIILLAAGSSSRMGQSKQLLKIVNETLIEHSVKAALNSDASHVVVVLGANEKNLSGHLKNYSLEIVYNGDWQKGMGSSIKAGINFTMNTTPSCDGVIIMVCDQPLIKPDNINNLISRFEETESTIVASAYENTLGVPALFNKSLFNELLKLNDEHGAKKIIHQHLDQVATVDFPEGALDIDTPTDYENLIKRIH